MSQSLGRNKRIVWESIGRPVLRGSITVIAAVGWFILSAILFQWWLPQFPFYETLLRNMGSTDNDAWYIWAWIPTMAILVLGIFWASGMFGKLWEALTSV